MEFRKAKEFIELLDDLDCSRCRYRGDTARILCPLDGKEVNAIVFGVTGELMGVIGEISAFLRSSGIQDITGISLDGSTYLRTRLKKIDHPAVAALGRGDVEELGGYEADKLTFFVTKDGIEFLVQGENRANGRQYAFRAALSHEELNKQVKAALAMDEKEANAAIKECFGAKKKKLAPSM